MSKEEVLAEFKSILDNDLCHRCGTCAGICPKKAISFNDNIFPEINPELCIGCKQCLKTCSGREFNYNSFTQEVFKTADLYDFKKTHGLFKNSYLIASNNQNIRECGSSGGVITQLLVTLLQEGKIDGALVVTSDKENLWQGRPTIAKTVEEILQASKSKYSISPTNMVLQELKKLDGRYAVVGLPCQIQSLRKAMKINLDLQKKVVLTIGLFCHSCLEQEAYREIWKHLGERRNDLIRYNPRKGKHPGIPTLEFSSKNPEPLFYNNHKKYQPNSTEILNILFRLYTQPRCFFCLDALSEFADIAVGDPYMSSVPAGVNLKDGWSFVLARTTTGDAILKELLNKRADFCFKELTDEQALKCNAVMAKNKKRSAYRLLLKKYKAKKRIPLYTDNQEDIPKNSSYCLKTNLDRLTHWFSYYKFGRKALFRILLGNAGYYLLWLNHHRKQFFSKRKKR